MEAMDFNPMSSISQIGAFYLCEPCEIVRFTLVTVSLFTISVIDEFEKRSLILCT